MMRMRFVGLIFIGLLAHNHALARQQLLDVETVPGGPTYGDSLETLCETYVFPDRAEYKGVGVHRDNVIAESVERDGNSWWFQCRARYSGRVLGHKIGAERVRIHYDNGHVRIDTGGVDGIVSTAGIENSIKKWISSNDKQISRREAAETPKGPRALDAKSNAHKGEVSLNTQGAEHNWTHGTLWKVEDAGEGLVRLRSWNRDYRDHSVAVWLDAASDGETVGVVGKTDQGEWTHGTLWKIEDAGKGLSRLRSWNSNYRDDANARWLDGASDGIRVSVVDGKSHGTRWKLQPAEDGAVILISYNRNFAP